MKNTKGIKPKYIEIYDQIREKILSSEYKTGEFLPCEGDLQIEYNASRTTIRKAIELLRKENLIKVKQGHGTTILPVDRHVTNFKKIRGVNNVFSRFLIDEPYETSTPGSIVDLQLATPEVAVALNINVGDQIYRLQHIESVNNEPFCYMVNFLPTNLFPDLETYSGKISRLYEFLAQNYQVFFESCEETLHAVDSGFIESKLLNIPSGTPLILFKRISRSNVGTFEYAETLIRPDIMQVVFSMGNEDYFNKPYEHI
ncbi:MAG: GntR family transcriptional regulator [Pseudobutyrivibrio ruminis]|nr:GntR family transcriptional regulator [Pseudobutyrivibrio ruminis]